MNTRPAIAADHPQLLNIWREAVRATHAFLSDADIVRLEHVVKDIALPALELWVLCDEESKAVGFMGLDGPKVEALFIAPAFTRRGGGRQLLSLARTLKGGPLSVDVNEQNPAAVAFYAANGFEVVGRSELDGQGQPFPILQMRQAT